MEQPPKKPFSPDENRIWLAKVRTVILYHANNNKLSIADVAKLLSISKRTFERRLKNLTGKTPKQYLNEFRLQLAHQLITRKQWSNVQEICFAVGFEGREYFSRIFKNHFGYSPSDLIKKVKKREDDND